MHLHSWLLCLSVLAWSITSALRGAEQQPAGRLELTVTDAATAEPVPCTVTLVDVTGRTVLDNDSFHEGIRCDGRLTRSLPAGRTAVRVTRGFETRVVQREVDIPAGGQVRLAVTLERVVDLRRRGWYSGDSHAHMLHGERTIPVTFDFVALTARAEDLQYLSLAQAWSLEDPTPERLEAELRQRSARDCVLTWNLEAPKNYYRGDAGRCLGHCWTLAMRGRTQAGADVIRALLDASAHDYESDKPTFANFESHALIHAQGGAVFYSHPARWWTGAWGGQGGYPRQEQMRVSNLAVELPLDTLVGPTFDGVDLLTGSGEFEANAMAFQLWCLLLNHGYRLAGTASSDACFDRPGGATPGVVRTYTLVEGEFTLAKAARAMAQGHTFVTSGPLLVVSLDGRPAGSTFVADRRSHRLQIEAWASGTDPKGLTALELLKNGQPIRTNRFHPPSPLVATQFTIPGNEPAWYCVRAFGSDPRRERAFSGAFFVESKAHHAPAPVAARVRVALQDASTGRELEGRVVELAYAGPVPRAGRSHRVAAGGTVLNVPATRRLRAEASGYRPMTLSPFLDHPELVAFITRLSAEDLLKWETYERIRALLGDTTLSFALERERP